MFPDKKLWIKMCKNFVEIFSTILSSRRALAPLKPEIWNWNWKYNYALSTNAENFSFVSLILSEKKPGQRTPQKTRKMAISQNRKWRHQNKKKYIKFYNLLSVLKISSISVEPSSRNRVHKIGKKKKNN